jgi:two-component system KDP operon response regulator KdpE
VSLVLLVEDDRTIARTLGAHLRAAELAVVWTPEGRRALEILRFEHPDVAVIDLMLPDLDGWTLLETARDEGITTPVVVISARGSEADKVHALELGADDYLAKPFGMAELVARVRAALRRSQQRPAATAEHVDVPGLSVDARLQQALLIDEDGTRRDARLTPTEFRLLWVLAQQQGRVMPREELLQRVWNIPYRPRDRAADVVVRKIREKIERGPYRYLHTQYGVGYRFAAELAGETPAGA